MRRGAVLLLVSLTLVGCGQALDLTSALVCPVDQGVLVCNYPAGENPYWDRVASSGVGGVSRYGQPIIIEPEPSYVAVMPYGRGAYNVYVH